MSAAPNFIEQAEREAREEFQSYFSIFWDLRDLPAPEWPEPEGPSWPRYSPEGEAYVAEFNRLAMESEIPVRIK